MTNLENLLVTYATSESKDVQDMLAKVAAQLGVSISDVRAAAQKDAKAQADAKKAADDAAAAADKKAQKIAKQTEVSKKHHLAEQTRRAADEYRRHRINNWWPSYASRVSGH